MGEFNEVYVILYRDEKDDQIKPILNMYGGMRLFITFTKANTVAKELAEKNGIEYYPHSIEIERKLFE